MRTEPTILLQLLVVGTDSGEVVALDPGSGKEKWRFATKGPILARPIERKGEIVVASGDGRVYGLNAKGEVAWQHELGAPVYAAPVLDGDRILLVDLDGALHVIENGEHRWKTAPIVEGPVESPLVVSGKKLLVGAWDSRVHALDVASGKELWAALGMGSQVQKAKKYYSPADAPLVVSKDRVFACDRDARLTVFELETGKKLWDATDAWACVADGEEHVLVKGSSSVRCLEASSGKTLWKRDVRLGRTPTPPRVLERRVWVASDDGELVGLALDDGKVVHRERVNPGELVLAPLGAWVHETGSFEGRHPPTIETFVAAGSLDGSVVVVEAR